MLRQPHIGTKFHYFLKFINFVGVLSTEIYSEILWIAEGTKLMKIGTPQNLVPIQYNTFFLMFMLSLFRQTTQTTRYDKDAMRIWT